MASQELLKVNKQNSYKKHILTVVQFLLITEDNKIFDFSSEDVLVCLWVFCPWEDLPTDLFCLFRLLKNCKAPYGCILTAIYVKWGFLRVSECSAIEWLPLKKRDRCVGEGCVCVCVCVCMCMWGLLSSLSSFSSFSPFCTWLGMSPSWIRWLYWADLLWGQWGGQSSAFESRFASPFVVLMRTSGLLKSSANMISSQRLDTHMHIKHSNDATAL